jgi:hypothetical protein
MELQILKNRATKHIIYLKFDNIILLNVSK